MLVVESLKKSVIYEEIKYDYWYRLIRSGITLDTGNGTMDIQSYGIEVERQNTTNDGMINIERESIMSISPQRSKVHSLLKIVADNSVSPIHLVDVLGEYVDEYVIDYDNILRQTVNC